MRATVHQSMVRGPLLGGGHPRLTVINAVLALAILSTGLHWWTVTLALGVGLGVQWALRAAAKRHVEWPVIYLRHLCEPAIRLAHGRAWGVPEKPKATVPPLPRWLP
jgi:type IV secretory pathway TrbD component